MKLWGTLCAMAREPHPQLAQMAADIIAYVSNQVTAQYNRTFEIIKKLNKNLTLAQQPQHWLMAGVCEFDPRT